MTWLSFGVGFILGAFFGLFAQRWFYRTRAAEALILELLAKSPEPMFGLDLIEQSDGLLKRDTVYVLLGRLEDRGLVVSAMSIHGRRRYALPTTARTEEKP